MNKLQQRTADKYVGNTYTSKHHGDAIVTRYVSSSEVHIKFANTGATHVVRANVLGRGAFGDPTQQYIPVISGTTPTVMGVGIRDDGLTNVANTHWYQTWSHMLQRASCPKFKARKPEYADVTVNPIWHSAKAFKSWYDEQERLYGNLEGLHLDKDSILPNNKTYHPDLCKFISPTANNVYAHTTDIVSTFEHPTHGKHTVRNLSLFGREFGLSRQALSLLVLGKQHSANGWVLVSKTDLFGNPID